MIATVTSTASIPVLERGSVAVPQNGSHVDVLAREKRGTKPAAAAATTAAATTTTTKPSAAAAASGSRSMRAVRSLLRCVVLDAPLVVLFAAFVFATVLNTIHEKYLHPQLQLMLFQEEKRHLTETTYYHRICGEDDFSATTPQELAIQNHFTTKDCVEHMLTHGASVYPDLLSNETATELREWIASENYRRTAQWGVIENENRYSWGIDINMHPKLQTYWAELAANDKLRTALEAIVGPDPAVIEFTAITSSYGATDQYMHADVIPSASAVKYARSFVPSYSLFIPLQDTTYEMGSTHVCPGSHLCADAEDQCNDYGAFAVSGDDPDDYWPLGHGALLNQQTFHKGMGYTQRGGIDRVLLIATFAPRPNFRHGVETRQIGQGGSYSLLWHQWGHTFSDFLHADKRMTEPQKTLRSLGLIKGNGWNYMSTLSMRMANEDTEMRPDNLEELLEEEDGLWFLPRSWQPTTWEAVEKNSDISDYHAFAIGVLRRVVSEFQRFYFLGLAAYVAIAWLLVVLQRAFGLGRVSQQSKASVASRLVVRVVALHGVVLGLAWLAKTTVDESAWARSIRNRKLYRIPVTEVQNPAPGTIPAWNDVLSTAHYSSDYLASYAKIVDYAHPGNLHWKTVTAMHAVPYASLTRSMKDSFCATLVGEVRETRRFLKQDEERFWTEVTNPDELIEWCDRALTVASDPMIEALATQVTYLQSETRFGKFRETTLATTTIPDYLRRWEDRLLGRTDPRKEQESAPFPAPKRTPSRRSPRFENLIYSPTRSGSSSVAATTTARRASSRIRSHSLPPQPEREEPFNGAWLQEGDRVEGWFGCNEDDEQWFPATITAAIPSDGSFDVLYDDGDTDEALAEECVRRLDDDEDEFD